MAYPFTYHAVLFVRCLSHCCSTMSSANAEQDVIVTLWLHFVAGRQPIVKNLPEMIELKSLWGHAPRP